MNPKQILDFSHFGLNSALTNPSRTHIEWCVGAGAVSPTLSCFSQVWPLGSAWGISLVFGRQTLIAPSSSLACLRGPESSLIARTRSRFSLILSNSEPPSSSLFMDLTNAECICVIVLKFLGCLTAFATAPGTQALLREVAVAIRAEWREEAERARRRRGRSVPERD